VRTWIGLFRGINVGGRNLLPMKELVALLAEEGFDEVRTYIQSGNVVFRGAGSTGAIGEHILAAVARRFGFRPHLLLYVHAPQGIGRSRLAARAESLLGVAATARNWRTVARLLEMARGGD
jgi:uncharacterized protein (DUF1697 family)